MHSEREYTDEELAEAIRRLQASPDFRLAMVFIDGQIAKRREVYENTEASEFNRGVLIGLKHIRKELSN